MKKRARTYLPSIFSGIAAALAFPSADAYPLAFFAMAPMLVSMAGEKPWPAFRKGLAFGLTFFAGTTYWVYYSMHHFGGMALPLSIVITGLLVAYLSLYPAVFAVFFARAMKHTSLPALLVAPVFWVVFEYLRGLLLTGFPGGTLGYSQYRFLHFIQIADITGVYGVSFVLMAVNGAIADIFILKQRKREMPLFHIMHTGIGFAALAVVLAAVFVYGAVRLREERTSGFVRAGIIQGSIEQDMKWDPKMGDLIMDIHEEMSAKAYAEGAELIVWPEAAVPYLYDLAPKAMDTVDRDLRAFGRDIVFGAVTRKGEKGGFVYANSAVLLRPDAPGKGLDRQVYDKIHLVPFGEYVPLRKILFFVERLAAGIGDFNTGSSTARMKSSKGEFGMHICYEIIFPNLVRKFYRTGGDFMVTVTNDAWFGTTTGPYHHFAMAVMRTVENRKALVRAANTGISAVVDSSGRVVGRTKLFERVVLTADVPIDRTRTFYTRFGDLFVYMCIVIALIVAFEPAKSSRR